MDECMKAKLTGFARTTASPHDNRRGWSRILLGLTLSFGLCTSIKFTLVGLARRDGSQREVCSRNRLGLCLTFARCAASVYFDLRHLVVGDIEDPNTGSRRSVGRSGDTNGGDHGGCGGGSGGRGG
jgi:hypothetical protein